MLTRDLEGLPVKPALRLLFLFQWYRHAHGGPTPKSRNGARSRVYRWWFSLSPHQRAVYAERGAREIWDFNLSLEARKLALAVKLADLKGKIARFRREASC